MSSPKQPTPPHVHRWPPDQGVPRPPHPVTAAQLKTMRDVGREVTFVDTRPRAAYERGHVPNAIHLPAGDGIGARAERWVPKRGTVVVYGDDCARCADRLTRAGWPVVRYLPAGPKTWSRIGGRLES